MQFQRGFCPTHSRHDRGAPTQAPPAQGKDPESVLRAITEALNKKDVEVATALLADDVAQTLLPAPSGTGIYKGKEAMRARFKEVVAGNPTPQIDQLPDERRQGDVRGNVQRRFDQATGL